MTPPEASTGAVERRRRAAVVGAGYIAQEHLACLSQLDEVEIVGVGDRSPSRAQATAERFGVEHWASGHRQLIDEVAPDVLHVTTPVTSHFEIARDALLAGIHVLVEKPITLNYTEWAELRDIAADRGLHLVESYNYLFDPAVLRIVELVGSRAFGGVRHVDVRFFQAIGDRGGRFADPNTVHPATSLRGGPLADFLPHLASIVHQLAGPHRTVSSLWTRRDEASGLPVDELVALVDAEWATATMAFNANTRPEGFWISVYGGAMQARINLYEGRLSLDRAADWPSPLVAVSNGLAEAWSVSRSSIRSLWGKLTGAPGSYTGLWVLIERLYRSLDEGAPAPVTLDQIDSVNRLVADCTMTLSPR